MVTLCHLYLLLHCCKFHSLKKSFSELYYLAPGGTRPEAIIFMVNPARPEALISPRVWSLIGSSYKDQFVED